MSYSLCGFVGANTGGVLCDVSRGITKKIAIFGGSILAADYASAALLEAALKEASLLPKKDPGKLFLFPVIEDLVDSSESNKEGSLNQGFKTILLEGKPAYTAKMFAGSEQVKRLRKFNNQIVRLVEFDANNRLWGTLSGTSVIGAKAKVFVSGQKAATGQNVEEGVVTIVISILDTTEYYDNAVFLDLADVNQNNIKALLDATLESAAAHAAEIFYVKAYIKTAQPGVVIDLYDMYADELAVVGAWDVKSGTALATNHVPDAVAKDDAKKGWAITIDPTEYGAIAGASLIQFNFKDPLTLDGLDVLDTEGVAVLIAK